jgi:hypothetical protein
MAELLREHELIVGQMYRFHWGNSTRGDHDIDGRYFGSSKERGLMFDYLGNMVALPTRDVLGAELLDL